MEPTSLSTDVADSRSLLPPISVCACHVRNIANFSAINDRLSFKCSSFATSDMLLYVAQHSITVIFVQNRRKVEQRSNFKHLTKSWAVIIHLTISSQHFPPMLKNKQTKAKYTSSICLTCICFCSKKIGSQKEKSPTLVRITLFSTKRTRFQKSTQLDCLHPRA